MSNLKNQLSMLDELQSEGYASLTNSEQHRISKAASGILESAADDIKKRAGFKPPEEAFDLQEAPNYSAPEEALPEIQPEADEAFESNSELGFVGGITKGLGEQTSATLGQTFISPLVGYNKLGFHGAEMQKFDLMRRKSSVENRLASIEKQISESQEELSSIVVPQVEAVVAGTVTAVEKGGTNPSGLQGLLVKQQELQAELSDTDAKLDELNNVTIPEWQRVLTAAEDQYKENQARVMAAIPEGISPIQEGIRAVPAVLGEMALTMGVGGGAAKGGQLIAKASPNVYANIAKRFTLGAMTANAVSRSSAEAIVEGLDTNSAFVKGVIDGGIELATEAVPLGKLFTLYKKGGDSAIKEYVELVASETLGENIAELAGTVNSLAFGMEEELAEAIRNHGLMSTQVLEIQARKQIVASVAGSLNAAVLGAPGALAKMSAPKPEVSAPDLASATPPDDSLTEATGVADGAKSEQNRPEGSVSKTPEQDLERIRDKDATSAARIEGIEAILEKPEIPDSVKASLGVERARLLDQYSVDKALDSQGEVSLELSDKKTLAAAKNILPANPPTGKVYDTEGNLVMRPSDFKTLVQDAAGKPHLVKALNALAKSNGVPESAKDFIKRALSNQEVSFLDVGANAHKNFVRPTVENPAVTAAVTGSGVDIVLSKISPRSITNVFPAKYAVVEAEDLALTFDSEKLKSAKAEANFYENFSGRTVESGAPVLAEDGSYALGTAEDRASSVIKAYRKGSAGLYKTALSANANALGLDSNQVSGMANPVLVRKIEGEGTSELVKGQSRTLYDADFNMDSSKVRDQISAEQEEALSVEYGFVRSALDSALGVELSKLIKFSYDPSKINLAKKVDAEGVFYKQTGEIYLFPASVKPYVALDRSGNPIEVMSEADRILWVAHHELFHRGFSLYDSRKYKNLLVSASKNKTVKTLADAIMAKRVTEGQAPLPEYIAVEEALAELSAANEMGRTDFIKSFYGVSVDVDNKVKTLIQKLADLIRDIVKKLTGKQLLLTDSQVWEVIAEINRENSEPTPLSSRYSLSPKEAKEVRIQREFREVETLLGGMDGYEKAYTNLPYKTWVQVRTPSFKSWFGDWESDPTSASKILDPETGEPLVVYHGTTQEFNTFELSAVNLNSYLGGGFYFSNSFDDSSANYGTAQSPDLNARIEHLSIQFELGHASRASLGLVDAPQAKIDSVIGDPDASLTLATEVLYGNKEHVKEIFLNARNPLIYNGSGQTVFTLQEDPADIADRFRDEFLADPDIAEEDVEDLVYEELYGYENSLVGPNGEDILNALHMASMELDVDYWQLEYDIKEEFQLQGDSAVQVTAQDLFEFIRLNENSLAAHDSEGGTVSEFIRKTMQNAGFDGVVMDAFEINQESWGMEYIDESTKHFISFSANDIKSAEENSGEFDPANPDIRFSVAPQALPKPEKVKDVTAKDAGVRAENTDSVWRYAHRTLFNDAAVLERAGSINPEGRALEIKFDNYKSMSTRRIEKEVAPLREELVEALSSTYKQFKSLPRYVDLAGKGLDQFVEDFFMVGAAVYHGEERNINIAVKTKGEDTSGSGFTFEEIKEIRKYYENEAPGLIEAYANVYKQSVKPMLDFSDNTLQEAGLLTQEMLEKQPDYEWYVPLYGRGDSADVFGSPEGPSGATIGARFKNKNPSAEGRYSKADNIFDNLVYKAERSVHRSEMQSVKQTLLDFANTEEGQKFLGSKVTTTKAPVREIDMAISDEDKSADLLIQKGAFSKLDFSKENEVVYFKDGEVTVIEINDQESLNLFVPVFSKLTDSQTISEAILNSASGASRFIGSFFTRFSATFLAVAKIKDSISASLFLAMRPSGGSDSYLGASMDVAKNSVVVAKANWNNLWMTSAIGKDNYLAAKKNMWLERYLDLGGGFTQANYFGKNHMINFMHELRKRNLSPDSSAAKTLAVEAKNKVRDALDLFGDHLELTTRVAVFKALVESGVPESEAAQFAKNIMNYNVKGSASKILSAFNPFYPTALYDFKRTSRDLFFTKQGRIVFAALVSAKLAVLNLLSYFSGEDEDGVKYIDKYSVSDMGNAFPVPYQDSRWAFKIPNGFGMDALAAVTAVNIRRLSLGLIPPDEAFQSTFTEGVLGELFPIRVSTTDSENKLKDALDVVTPYAIKPLFDLSRNLKYNGAPIHRDPEFLPKGALRSDSGYYHTSEGYKRVAQSIFKYTGVDIFPETLQHLDRSYLGQYTGSVLGLIGYAAGVRYEKDNDLNLPEKLKGAPVIRGFVQYPYRTDSENYRAYRKELNDTLARTIKARANGAEPDSELYAKLAVLALAFKESERQLRGINRDIKVVRQAEELSRTEKNSALDKLDEAKRLIQMQINSTYAKSMK